jgi:ferredoxin-NADP reductase
MSSEPTTYLVKLKNRFSVAERTTAFQFEKPTNFIFRPGQWIDITLLNPAETDAEGNVRGFSIASASNARYGLQARTGKSTLGY